jgi:RecA-family ATPase
MTEFQRPWPGERTDGPKRISPQSVFAAAMPTMTMALPGLLAGTIGLIVGPGGVSKSMLALQTSVSVAVGRDVWNLWSHGADAAMPSSGRVVYMTLEDPALVVQCRLKAMEGALSAEERGKLEERLDLWSWTESRTRFSFARRGPGGEIERSAVADDLAAHADGACLVIVDTLNQAIGNLDENSSADMGGLVWAANGVCAAAGCSMLIPHHTSKSASNASKSSGQQNQNDARGSSALPDNVRWQLGMRTMSTADTEARNVPDEERRRWVEVDVTKVNFGSTPPKRWIRRGSGGILDGRAPLPTAVAGQPRKLAVVRTVDGE